MSDWRDAISAYMTPSIRKAIEGLSTEDARRATELRLRAGGRAVLCVPGPLPLAASATAQEIRLMADAMLGHVAHARQEELRHGFVTLAGGCRAGLCGRAVIRDGRLFTLQDIGGVTIRIAREVKGAADELMPFLLREDGPRSALILSPPGLGKTTLLRDAARQLSESAYAVSIVDERSEIAACVRGVPTLDVGGHTDVLDGCPKAEGISLMLRAMAPQILITDELGSPGDAEAVAEAARCGVAVIATAHGRGLEDAMRRPSLSAVLGARVFDMIIALCAIGKVGAIWDAEGRRIDERSIRGGRRAGVPIALPVAGGGVIPKDAGALRVEPGAAADRDGAFLPRGDA